MDLFVMPAHNWSKQVNNVVPENMLIYGTEEVNLNSVSNIEFAIDIKNNELINEGDVIYFRRNQKDKLYRVVKKSIENELCIFYGIDEMDFIIERYAPLPEMRFQNQRLRDVMIKIFEEKTTDNRTIEVGSVQYPTNKGYFSGSFCNQTRASALEELSKQCNVEFEKKIFVNNEGEISKLQINSKEKIGEDRNVFFEYGSNLLKVVKESDSSETYNRIIGLGKGKETENGYGRRIDFSEISFSRTGFTSKPKGQRYLQIGSSRNQSTKIVVFEDIEDPNELIERSAEWLLENSRPKVHFETEAYTKEVLNIGDRVNISRHDLGIHYKARVFKITYDLKKDNTKYEFGDTFLEKPIKKLENTISSSPNLRCNNLSADNVSFLNLKSTSLESGNIVSNQFITKVSPGEQITINPIQLVNDFKKINFKINDSGDLDIDETSMLNTEVLKSAIVTNDQNEIVGIDYNKIIPWLVAAFQNNNKEE